MNKKDILRIKKNNALIKLFKDAIFVPLSTIDRTCIVCPVQFEFRDIKGNFYYFRARHGGYRLNCSTLSFDDSYAFVRCSETANTVCHDNLYEYHLGADSTFNDIIELAKMDGIIIKVLENK